MTPQPHEQTEYEFAAKAVNDLLRKRFKNRNVQFLTFVMDEGSSGYMGYIASTRRIDAIRVIFEWLERMLPSLDRTQVREMLELLDKET